MNTRRVDSASLIGAAVVCLLCVVACLGFSAIFNGWGFLVPVVAAAVACTALSLISRRTRLLAGEVVLLYTAGFLVCGMITTQWVPNLGSFGDFASALVNGWADILSSQPPADLRSPLSVVPFTVAWLTTAFAQEFDRRAGSIALPLLGVLGGLVATSLFSEEVRSIAQLQGPVLVGLSVLLAIVHRQKSEHDAGVTANRVGHRGPLKILVPAGLLLLVGVAASLLGPRLPLADSADRFDLRELQENPWDPLREPSPLVTIKAQLKPDAADNVVFRVTSDMPITRWTVARMASYSGVVWEVADASFDSLPQFVPVDTTLPAAGSIDLEQTAPVVQAEIEIVDLGSVWVPHAGAPTFVDFGDLRDLRLNIDTATLAAPDGLRPGDRYTLTSRTYADVDSATVALLEIADDVESIEIDLLPAPILNLADSFVMGRDYGGQQVAAIRDLLVDERTAFYDVSNAQPPGHSYGRIAQFVESPDRLVGYEEQYAATAGVLGRIAGIPTRVVVGYLIDADRYSGGVAEVRSSDVSAWIEVLVVDRGWVPVDVTPDSSNEPTEVQEGNVSQPISVPNEPPPPPPPFEQELPQEEEEDEEEEEEDEEEEGPIEADRSLIAALLERPALAALTVAASPLAGFAVLGAIAAGLKAARTKRRREDPVVRRRISGAWAELVDRFEETGMEIPKNATPLELAERLHASGATAKVDHSVNGLVSLVNRSAFAAEPPTEADTTNAWATVDLVSSAVTSDLPLLQRIRMRVDPRPLLRRTPKDRNDR